MNKKRICIPNNGAEPFIAEYIGKTENNCPIFEKDGSKVFFGGANIAYSPDLWRIIQSIGNDGDKLFKLISFYSLTGRDVSRDEENKISWDELP
jgi:hypothetical protein